MTTMKIGFYPSVCKKASTLWKENVPIIQDLLTTFLYSIRQSLSYILILQFHEVAWSNYVNSMNLNDRFYTEWTVLKMAYESLEVLYSLREEFISYSDVNFPILLRQQKFLFSKFYSCLCNVPCDY